MGRSRKRTPSRRLGVDPESGGGVTDQERAEAYVEKAIAQTLRRATEAPDGMRNAALSKEAHSFGRMVLSGWIDEHIAAVQLLQACEANGLLKDDGPRACGATIAGGIKHGKLGPPAQLPEDLRHITVFGGVVPQVSPEAIANAMRAEEERRIQELATADTAEAALTSREYWEQVTSSLLRHAGATRELARRAIDLETAETFGVGYDDFPLGDAPERYGPPGRRPSLVLPWASLDRPGHYDAVQYRHLDGEAPKVHWHHALRSAKLFNAHALTHPHSDELFVVEGALSALTLISAGITSTVALPQLRPKKETVEALAQRMDRFERVWWLCDKGALPVWSAFATKVPDGRGVVAALSKDPDDFLVACGGDVDLFWRAIQHSVAA